MKPRKHEFWVWVPGVRLSKQQRTSLCDLDLVKTSAETKSFSHREINLAANRSRYNNLEQGDSTAHLDRDYGFWPGIARGEKINGARPRSSLVMLLMSLLQFLPRIRLSPVANAALSAWAARLVCFQVFCLWMNEVAVSIARFPFWAKRKFLRII